MSYILFGSWLYLPSMMFLSFIHVITWINGFFLFLAELTISKMDTSQFAYSLTQLMDILGCFNFGVGMNKAAVNIQVFR